MADPIEDLSQRWKKNPDSSLTIALCEALRGTSRATLVQQVGEVATQRYASEVPVLIAVARMYLDAQRLSDAQSVLVNAGKVAPRDGLVYRWLGEVLLRRGDAERAEKVLERAIEFRSPDPETPLWLDRARVYKPVQARAGARAVATEIASAAPTQLPRLAMDSLSDDSTTAIRVADVTDNSDDPTEIRDDNPLHRRHSTDAPTVPFPTPMGDLRAAHDYALKKALATGDIAAPGPPAQAQAAPQAPARPAPPPAPRKPAPPAPMPKAAPAPNPFLTNDRAPAFSPPPIVGSGRAGGARDGAGPARRADVTTGEAQGIPNPKDVLEALALAGVFEPMASAGALGWDRPPRARRRGTIMLSLVTLLFVGGGIGAYRYVTGERQKAHLEADAVLEKVEADMHASRPSLLPGMEQALGHAFEQDSRSPRAALDWLRERALVGLLKSGADLAFEDSIARAKEVGVADQSVAFARLASFLFQGDTAGAAGLMPKWDGPAANDAWYELLAGATLEHAGDSRAFERYTAAVRLDPNLMIAQVLLTRSTAIDGDPTRAADLAKQFRTKFPDRAEGAALVALAWGRDPARGEKQPPEAAEMRTHAAELPAPLAAVPHALDAIDANDRHAFADAKKAIVDGLGAADGPGMATWLGSIALDTRDEALVRKAALVAVGFSAVYPPARVLAARVALLGDRLDEALKATEELDSNSPDVVVVRAATAYERVDADGIGHALDAVSADAKKLPFLNALILAQDVLLGRASKMSGRAILEMSDDEAPWSDLVAMDLALDLGELEVADKIGGTWKGSEDNALRALRLSRLARYQNKLDVADTLSRTALEGGTVTPRTLIERVLVLIAKNKIAEVNPLLAKYPLVLGPSATWLSAYAAAAAGKVEEARGKAASIDPPPALAPLPSRVIAAIALAAMRDRARGIDYIKALLSSGVQDPDLVAAALSFGFHRVDHARRRATFE